MANLDKQWTVDQKEKASANESMDIDKKDQKKHKHRRHHKKHKKRSLSIDNSDDSDMGSLAEDLDQIGKLNLNLNLSSYISKDYLGGLTPSLPTLPNFPNFELGRIQEFSKEFSRYVTNYINATNEKIDEDDAIKDQQRFVSSVKTAISTRIQMTNFLNDLKKGLNLNTAIERLQPLTEIINEAISLPVEDISDFEDDYGVEHPAVELQDELDKDWTEPVGVDKIVNSDHPLINEIIKPNSRPRRSRRQQMIDAYTSNDESGTQTSDLDNIEGLSIEEVRALTDLSSLNDFTKEELLRMKIRKIQNLANLNQKLKNKLVTRLMMGNYYKYINENLADENVTTLPRLRKQTLVLEENSNDADDMIIEEDEEEGVKELMILDESEDNDSESDEVILSETDLQPTYSDEFNTILGCQHYQRNCKVECATCLKWYPCRFCHDADVTSHKLVRTEVKHILCMKCFTPQEPELNNCVNSDCEAELANYFCSKCVLYDNDATKDIYHCDKCGICRLGLGIGKDYFHCDECNICLSIDLKERHKCVNNTTHCNCPICSEYLFTSVHKVVFMKCGHSIHQHCYDELIKHLYKCPMCKKTVVNAETQFRILDQEITQSPMPEPYNMWRCIISCNDCKGKSNAPYHVLGLKCKYCKSYNTNQPKLIKPEEEDDEVEQQEEDDENGERNFDANLMRLVETNLQRNFRIDGGHPEEESSGYEDDEDDEELDIYDDHSEVESMLDIQRLTALMGRSDPQNQGQSNISYITSIFQTFINNASRKPS